MAAQLSIIGAEYFNPEPEVEEIEGKRIRYEIPTYIKFYSLYQYDRDKFTKLLQIWLDTDAGKNRTIETLKEKQNEILELCYIRDDNGNPLRDSDEQYVKWIKPLTKIHELIYNYTEKVALDNRERYMQDGLWIYPNEQQAEIIGTWQLPIKKRVKIHIRLLRLLRKDLSIKEALCKIKLSSTSGI